MSLSLIVFKVQAQNSADEKLGTWYMYNGSHKLSDKYAIKTMAHFRYFELASDFQQEIYRLGINYTFSPKINVTLGYSYVNTDPSYKVESPLNGENRIYEDLNIGGAYKKFKLKHRIRLEHRFLDSTTSHWFRYDFNLSYPLAKNWNAYVFNEIFLNIDVDKRFVQNWTGAGVVHKLNNSLQLKMGYFQIKLPDSTLKRLQLGIILNTNHLKKS